MNLIDFKYKIDKIVKNHPNPSELEVIVPIMGMGGARENVKGVGLGFDWYNNCVCLYTEEMLVRKIRK